MTGADVDPARSCPHHAWFEAREEMAVLPMSVMTKMKRMGVMKMAQALMAAAWMTRAMQAVRRCVARACNGDGPCSNTHGNREEPPQRDHSFHQSRRFGVGMYG
jgi:hypothetical protein